MKSGHKNLETLAGLNVMNEYFITIIQSNGRTKYYRFTKEYYKYYKFTIRSIGLTSEKRKKVFYFYWNHAITFSAISRCRNKDRMSNFIHYKNYMVIAMLKKLSFRSHYCPNNLIICQMLDACQMLDVKIVTVILT